MNAESLLVRVAAALEDAGLQAIVIGNAGAALQGSPVSTIDIDLFFRDSSANIRKLSRVAALLNATWTPAVGDAPHRIECDEQGIYLDFIAKAHGIRSFASLRSRATTVVFADHRLLVAALEDIIRSKRAAAHPGICPSWRFWRRRSVRKSACKTRLRLRPEALPGAPEDEDLRRIRRLLALPMNRRTHFLRVRLPGGGSGL